MILHLKSVVRFGIVGAIGTFVNMCVFSFLSLNFLSNTLASTAAFFVAVSVNYILNARWSFSFRTQGVLSISSYIFYILANTGGLLVNLAILYFVSNILGYNPLLGQFIGIMFGMIINYLASYFFVFK